MNNNKQSGNTAQLSPESKVEIGAILTPTAPLAQPAEVYSGMIQASYGNVVKASQIATPLQKAFIAEMQKTAGYSVDTSFARIVKDVQGNVSGIVTISNDDPKIPEGTFYNVKAALAAGYLKPVKAEPSQQLVSAIKALDGAIKQFNEDCRNALLPLMVGVPKKGKNVNMPTGSGVRTPSKGFVSDEEWLAISDAEKEEFAMSYDGTAITLLDGNSEKHVCRSITALKRHENGEGHAKA